MRIFAKIAQYLNFKQMGDTTQKNVLKCLRKIVICGNIGVGKTTAVRRLVNSIQNSEAVFEQFEENEHLPGFYKVLEEKGSGHYNEYCYPTQMAFLTSRAKRELKCQDPERTYILDRGLMEDKYIFGKNQIDQGFMSEKEIERYTQQFDQYMEQCKLPDLVVYLKADINTLTQRIKKRGRDMEANISQDYLRSLQTLYDENLIPALEEKYSNIMMLKYDTTPCAEDDVFRKVVQDILLFDKYLTSQKED